ncbi:MAG TPA: hypothetical protein ENI07_15230 [Desulfobacterales bacterium]|nr:hypothetical protein [Desulfobacterales bacterium]
MKKIVFWTLMTAIFFGLAVFFPNNAEAIPTFARKYKTSCSTCHIAIPKRNAFGDAFRRLGFRIPGGDEGLIKEEPVSLGAEAWKKVWPETIWPGLLPATVPISFYGHQRFVWKEDADASTTFDAPHELEMLIGGNYGDRISFFGEWIVYEKEYADDRDKLGALYLQFNDLLGSTPGMLNFKFGKFETGASRGHKDDNRLTPSHPMPYDYTVSGGGNDKKLRQKQAGLELNGILASRFEYAVGIVNGNGSTADNNSDKDLFGRVAYKFGGMGLDGSGGEPGEQLVMKDNWRDDSITVGVFGYLGKPSDKGTPDEDYTRLGVDLSLKFGRFDIGAAYVAGNDEVDGGADIDSSSFFVDVQYLFYPWLLANVRYGQKEFDSDQVDTEVVIANITLLQRANIRWNVEYFTFLDDEDGDDTVKANLMFAF